MIWFKKVGTYLLMQYINYICANTYTIYTNTNTLVFIKVSNVESNQI